jgi:hypothetical protein
VKATADAISQVSNGIAHMPPIQTRSRKIGTADGLSGLVSSAADHRSADPELCDPHAEPLTRLLYLAGSVASLARQKR